MTLPPPAESQTMTGRHVVRGTAITAALTLVSRVLGFFRDLIVAQAFGAGIFADCYFVAFRIPNLLRAFVAEGALSAAFVPVFSGRLVEGRTAAQEALSIVTGFLLIVTSILATLGMLFSHEIVRVFAPGFSAEQHSLSAWLTALMMPYIIFISIVAMLNGALNSLKIFGTSASAQSVMNVVLIAGGILASFYEPAEGVVVLSLSVVVGGVVQIVFQIPALRRSGLSLRPLFRLNSPVLRQLLILMFPAILGATVYQLSLFISTVFASLLAPGSVSWLFYADRLVQLPIGIFSIALASVLLPALSLAQAQKDSSNFHAHLSLSLRYTTFLMLPASMLLFLCAEPLVQVLFERGAFTHRSTVQTAHAVRAMSLGIWCTSAHSMLIRAFMARKDNRTPTLIGIGTLCTSVLASLLFMGAPVAPGNSWFAETFLLFHTRLSAAVPTLHLGHTGLALASSISSLFAFSVAGFCFSRAVPDFTWSGIAGTAWRTLVATLVTGALIGALPLDGLHPGISLLIIAVCASALFMLCAWFLGIRELNDCASVVMRKIRRKS